MHEIYLLLGSNEDNRQFYLEAATQKIKSLIGEVIKTSSVFESEPWGFDASQWFLNQVLIINSIKEAGEILQTCQAIESELGRIRKNDGFQSRTIDIDILFFNSEIINTPRLIVPHPEIQNRLFTLLPLQELNGAFVHPVFHCYN
jgi:2-amino-4-hydroxy-6-hydroxymethyldihydropteridine diphosphokinase